MDHEISTEKQWRTLQLNLSFVAWVNIFMGPSDHDEIPLCKMLYFGRGTGLLAE
jgi:hypothetical protein